MSRLTDAIRRLTGRVAARPGPGAGVVTPPASALQSQDDYGQWFASTHDTRAPRPATPSIGSEQTARFNPTPVSELTNEAIDRAHPLRGVFEAAATSPGEGIMRTASGVWGGLKNVLAGGSGSREMDITGEAFTKKHPSMAARTNAVPNVVDASLRALSAPGRGFMAAGQGLAEGGITGVPGAIAEEGYALWNNTPNAPSARGAKAVVNELGLIPGTTFKDNARAVVDYWAPKFIDNYKDIDAKSRDEMADTVGDMVYTILVDPTTWAGGIEAGVAKWSGKLKNAHKGLLAAEAAGDAARVAEMQAEISRVAKITDRLNGIADGPKHVADMMLTASQSLAKKASESAGKAAGATRRVLSYLGDEEGSMEVGDALTGGLGRVVESARDAMRPKAAGAATEAAAKGVAGGGTDDFGEFESAVEAAHKETLAERAEKPPQQPKVSPTEFPNSPTPLETSVTEGLTDLPDALSAAISTWSTYDSPKAADLMAIVGRVYKGDTETAEKVFQRLMSHEDILGRIAAPGHGGYARLDLKKVFDEIDAYEKALAIRKRFNDERKATLLAKRAKVEAPSTPSPERGAARDVPEPAAPDLVLPQQKKPSPAEKLDAVISGKKKLSKAELERLADELIAQSEAAPVAGVAEPAVKQADIPVEIPPQTNAASQEIVPEAASEAAGRSTKDHATPAASLPESVPAKDVAAPSVAVEAPAPTPPAAGGTDPAQAVAEASAKADAAKQEVATAAEKLANLVEGPVRKRGRPRTKRHRYAILPSQMKGTPRPDVTEPLKASRRSISEAAKELADRVAESRALAAEENALRNRPDTLRSAADVVDDAGRARDARLADPPALDPAGSAWPASAEQLAAQRTGRWEARERARLNRIASANKAGEAQIAKANARRLQAERLAKEIAADEEAGLAMQLESVENEAARARSDAYLKAASKGKTPSGGSAAQRLANIGRPGYTDAFESLYGQDGKFASFVDAQYPNPDAMTTSEKMAAIADYRKQHHATEYSLRDDALLPPESARAPVKWGSDLPLEMEPGMGAASEPLTSPYESGALSQEAAETEARLAAMGLSPKDLQGGEGLPNLFAPASVAETFDDVYRRDPEFRKFFGDMDEAAIHTMSDENKAAAMEAYSKIPLKPTKTAKKAPPVEMDVRDALIHGPNSTTPAITIADEAPATPMLRKPKPVKNTGWRPMAEDQGGLAANADGAISPPPTATASQSGPPTPPKGVSGGAVTPPAGGSGSGTGGGTAGGGFGAPGNGQTIPSDQIVKNVIKDTKKEPISLLDRAIFYMWDRARALLKSRPGFANGLEAARKAFDALPAFHDAIGRAFEEGVVPAFAKFGNEHQDDVRAYLVASSFIDRAKQAGAQAARIAKSDPQKAAKLSELSRWWIKKATDAKAIIVNRMNMIKPGLGNELENVQKAVNEFTRTQGIERLVEVKAISREAADTLYKTNPNYMRFTVLERDQDAAHLMERTNVETLEKYRNTALGTSPAKGDLHIFDPISETFSTVTEVRRFAEKTHVQNELLNNYADALGWKRLMTKKEAEALNLKPGQYWERGVSRESAEDFTEMTRVVADSKLPGGSRRETWLVPKDIALTMEHISPRQRWFFSNVMNNLWRTTVTTLNPAFTVRNIQRDFISAFNNSAGVYKPSDLLSYVFRDYPVALAKSIAHTYFPKSAWAKEVQAALEAGMGFGFTGTLREQSRAQKKLFKSLPSKIWNHWANPLEILQRAAATVEIAPRMAVYRKAQSLGLGTLDSALAAKAATIDYNAGGVFAKSANEWVPFLNARIQAARSIVNAIKKRPAETIMKMALTNGVLALSAYAVNKIYFSDVMDEVDKDIKDKYHVWIVGSDKVDPKTGRRVPTALLSPKMPGSEIWDITTAVLDNLESSNPKAWFELMVNVLGDAIGIDSDKGIAENLANTGLETINTVIGPQVAGLVSAMSGTRPGGGKVVPGYLASEPKYRQYKDSTPEVYKWLADNPMNPQGRNFNVSPLSIQTAAEGFIGSYGTDRSPLLDPLGNLQSAVYRDVGGGTEDVLNPLLDQADEDRRRAIAVITDAYDAKDAATVTSVQARWNDTVMEIAERARRSGANERQVAEVVQKYAIRDADIKGRRHADTRSYLDRRLGIPSEEAKAANASEVRAVLPSGGGAGKKKGGLKAAIDRIRAGKVTPR